MGCPSSLPYPFFSIHLSISRLRVLFSLPYLDYALIPLPATACTSMAFSLTRPPSPIRAGHISVQGHDEDHLSSALHAALSSSIPGSSAHPDHHHDMIKEKERVSIDVVVDSDCLSLKGTGVDVEPALLKGHIVLHLREPTSIKEVTLQFRGKVRLPVPLADA